MQPIVEKFITLDQEAVDSPNLCDRFDPSDLDKIGKAVVEGYRHDKLSRAKWERRMQAAMDLAMQVQKAKTFPWPNSSNVAFPLVTIGGLQFHSNAYPTIVQGRDVVKMNVWGPDSTGNKSERARRVSTHMSWQVLEQDKSWEQQQDRLLLNLSIVGTVFKKSYYKAEKGYPVAEMVLAQNLVVNYWAKSLEDCPRKTHIIPLFRNDIYTGVQRKIYRDVLEEAWYEGIPGQPSRDASTAKVDNRHGETPPMPDQTTPFIGLEQHVDMDLDGDGYAEPYIITVEESSEKVLRIVTGFDQMMDIERTKDNKIISINRMEYFTKYTFIPSPDGGIYDVGFGILLGPLNESVNSLVNQLIDAGTWMVTAGGFLGRGAKIRGGVYTFAPLEWKRVDSPGDDLRKNIVPHEPREPSAVLFQLLSLLIQYVNRVAGATDSQVGENPGQNTPAETMRTMVEQGRKIYNAVYKRIWVSMKDEFKKRYVLNGIYLPIRSMYGKDSVALREDYLQNPDDVVPSADPNVTSDAEAVQQAMFLKQSAATTPGYDIEAVERRVLKALKIEGIDQIYPGIQKTGIKEDPKLQIQKLKNELGEKELESERLQFVAELLEEQRMNNAMIAQIQAEIQTAQLDVQGDAEDRRVAMMQSVLKMLGEKDKQIIQRMNVVIKALEVKRASIEANAGNVERLEGARSDESSSSSSRKQKKAA